MTILPERPYVQFNFLVHLGGPAHGPDAGFQEISGIGQEAALAADATKSVRKITGLNKAADVTFKRGVVSSLGFQQWLNDIRAANPNALRDVTVQMQNEDHTVVRTWKLVRARIIKHTSGPLSAKSTDVAMEELVLGCERLEVET